MNKFKKFLSAPLVSGILFAAAAVLIILSSVNGARAAVSIFSDDYSSEIVLYDIGVTLTENGSDISWRNYNRRDNDENTGEWETSTGELLTGLSGTQVQLGTTYPEVIAARNSGTIDQYVRITVMKYWEEQDTDGSWEKVNYTSGLTPDLIDIAFVTDEAGYDGNWVEDTDAATAERRVFYYTPLLTADPDAESAAEADPDSITEPLTSTIAIKEGLADVVSYNDGNTIAYRYEGKKFVVEATVDAVQDHHADEAKMSAWGQLDPEE